jgi:aryl-alcohol dehydrogenase-like predicted oxidoreductase
MDLKTAAPPAIPFRALGASGARVPALGVGTNRWGVPGKGADVLIPVFSAALDLGANLFDTAEVYQFGGSETAIGECLRRDPRPALVVSKFAPYPTRFSSRSLLKALEASLARLGTQSVDLYLIHFPFTFLSLASLMDMLAEAARAGRVRAVGVSNFSAKQMVLAADRLARHGLPLAANEVHFSLFHRDPERNGVLETCRKLDIALIAYRPLARGRNPQEGSPLDRTLAGIAQLRQKTVAQVALNWLLRKDEHIITIPGTTSVAHLRENVGAVGWTLSDSELAALEQSSA